MTMAKNMMDETELRQLINPEARRELIDEASAQAKQVKYTNANKTHTIEYVKGQGNIIRPTAEFVKEQNEVRLKAFEGGVTLPGLWLCRDNTDNESIVLHLTPDEQEPLLKAIGRILAQRAAAK